MSNTLALNLSALPAHVAQRAVHEMVATAPAPLGGAVSDSPATAAARAAALTAELPALVLLVGGGLGYLLEALEQRRPGISAIVIEPDAVRLRQFLARRDWRDWISSGRLVLIAGPDYLGASAAWRPAVFPAVAPPILIDEAAAAVHPTAARAAEAVARRIITEARANSEARRQHAGRYLLHTLSNAPLIAREGNAADLAGQFAGVAAVIVGAGPSLDGMLPAIAAVRDRALIIACDTAARPLLAAGISPHFIVAVDPAESNALHLAALLNPRGSWLVAEGSLHPTAFAAFGGRTFTFNVSDHHPWPWLDGLGIGRGRLAAWGSVATSALDLALAMGSTAVAFAGLDFAFTDGHAYCRGTTFEAQWATWMAGGHDYAAICRLLIERWPHTEEADAAGRPVRTAPHLIAFRNWMRQRIELAPAEIRFANVSRGGLLHHARIEHTTLEAMLAPAAALDQAALDLYIRQLHRPDHGASERLYAAIDRLGDQPAAAGDPRADWIAFAGEKVTREMIAAALRSNEYDAWCRGRAASQDRTLLLRGER